MKLTELAPSVWTLAIPHRFLGLEFGTRMNVVQLSDGGVVVHSPVPPDPELVEQVRGLGAVRFLVAPSIMHHLYITPWHEKFPDARIHVPRALLGKRPDLSGSAVLGEGAGPGAPDLLHLEIGGCERWLGENVFVHPASGTLVVADLVSNLPATDHLWTRAYATLMGFHDRVAVSRAIRPSFRDRRAARRSLDALLDMPWTKIAVGHGNVIDRDAKDALRAAYAWL